MQIYFSPNSPFVRKCLVSAHELGLQDRITLLDCNVHPINRDRTVVENNPLGKLPTFLTDDGQVLYDSRVICEYLNELAGGTLFPRPGPARWQALTLQSLGDGILDAAVLARYETFVRPEEKQWPQWRDAQLDKVATSLSHLEANPSLLEGRVDIGSITIACALWYMDHRFATLGWRERHPAVARWHAAFAQRPSMQKAWSL